MRPDSETMPTETAEVLRRRFDWALREVVGGDDCPDVTDRVLARYASGETERSPQRSRWQLAAAATALLGVGAVVAAVVASRADSGWATAPGTAAAQGSSWVSVTDRKAIAALPPGSRAVELRNQSDGAIAELVLRCPELERLRIFAATAYRRVDDAAPLSITDTALADVATLVRLRHLELVGTTGLIGSGLGRLRALPMLEELALTHFDLDDDALQVVAELPSLRRLNLTLNHGFGDRGVAAIANCPGLRRLSLHGCSQLHADSIARLGALGHLVELNLSQIGDTWRGSASAALAERDRARNTALRLAAEERGAGLTLDGLPGWPKLRQLNLSGNRRLAADVGEVLRKTCPKLVDVNLASCPSVNDVTVAELLALRGLRRLNVSSCANVTAFSVPLLRAARQLRQIDLWDTVWLTEAYERELVTSGKTVRTMFEPSLSAWGR